jgi:hypothetical protein
MSVVPIGYASEKTPCFGGPLKKEDLNITFAYNGATIYGATTFDLGNFTLPADLAPGSTAQVYVQYWSAGFDPAAPANPMEFIFGFTPESSTMPVYPNTWGFEIQAANAGAVPNPIPPRPAAEAGYTQLPQYVTLLNVNPGQTIYLTVTCLNAGDGINQIEVYVPHMLYTAS